MYAFSSCSAQVTLVTRSLTYAWTVSTAGRAPVLVSRTVARTVSVALTCGCAMTGSEYSIVV